MLSRKSTAYYDMRDVCSACCRKRDWRQIFSQYAVNILDVLIYSKKNKVIPDRIFDNIKELNSISRNNLTWVIDKYGNVKTKQGIRNYHNEIAQLQFHILIESGHVKIKEIIHRIQLLFGPVGRISHGLYDAVCMYEMSYAHTVKAMHATGIHSPEFYTAATSFMRYGRSVGSSFTSLSFMLKRM